MRSYVSPSNDYFGVFIPDLLHLPKIVRINAAVLIWNVRHQRRNYIMPFHFPVPLILAAIGLVIAAPAFTAENEAGQAAAPLDAATPITELRRLCREETSIQSGIDVDAILQRSERAKAACDRLIDASRLEGSDLAGALLDRADLYAPGNGDAHARALADYDRAIALAPDFAAAYWRRGKANLLYARNLEAALRDLDEAIRLDPSQAEFLVTRASILGWLGKPDAALADLNRALSLDPRSEHALTNRGLAYFNEGDLSRALADFDAALQLAPEDSGLYSFRAAARRQAGDEAGAKADEAKTAELMAKETPR
jgi:tetratricopeptide (TPR) repeat protein